MGRGYPGCGRRHTRAALKKSQFTHSAIKSLLSFFIGEEWTDSRGRIVHQSPLGDVRTLGEDGFEKAPPPTLWPLML